MMAATLRCPQMAHSDQSRRCNILVAIGGIADIGPPGRETGR